MPKNGKNTKQDVQIAEMRKDVTNFCSQMIELKAVFQDFKQNEFQHLSNKVEVIGNSLKDRPTWSVSIIITFLSSLCLGLIVYILTNSH